MFKKWQYIIILETNYKVNIKTITDTNYQGLLKPNVYILQRESHTEVLHSFKICNILQFQRPTTR